MISSIYNSFENHLPQEVNLTIKNIIQEGLSTNGHINVFFRADDIGVQSINFSRMMSLFLKYRIPLCLAVVPAWLTEFRWKTMDGFIKKGEDLFCWHMHGYRHINHETQGKKQEFGPARSDLELANDLSRGHARLKSIMGKMLTPVFTPPWNRCSLATMNRLKIIGFKGVSRSYGSLPLPPRGFKDFPVHVDLHTRKEKLAEQGWQKLMEEFTRGMDSSACGIMIHHMLMNDQAFIFLEYLLKLFTAYKKINFVTFNDLMNS